MKQTKGQTYFPTSFYLCGLRLHSLVSLPAQFFIPFHLQYMPTLMLIRDSPILCIHHSAFALYKISFTHSHFMLQLPKYRTYVPPHILMCSRYVAH